MNQATSKDERVTAISAKLELEMDVEELEERIAPSASAGGHPKNHNETLVG